jgi:uncharacterized surface protein with fasciclin (FAS1) repeats
MHRFTPAFASLVAVFALSTPALAGDGCKGKGVSARSDGYLMKVAHQGDSGMVNRGTEKDIVDTAVAAGSFNTLVTAVKAADLVEALKGEGPYTVFAPTDAAFAKLPAGTLEGLLADKDKLTQVLTYHVVAGEITSETLGDQDSWVTLEGSAVPVSAIKVSQADIETSNGVIHVIDEVLIPQM